MSVIVAALLSLGLSAPAVPPQEAPPPVMRVSYAEADLATPAGRALFRNRLDQTTRAFCAVHRSTVTPQHVRASNYCERSMRAAAMRELPMNVRRRLAAD